MNRILGLLLLLTFLLIPTNAPALSFGVCAETYPNGSCGYGGTGNFNPLAAKGVLTVASSDSDSWDSGLGHEIASAAVFGSDASWDTQWKQLIAGYAIEPMAHAVAETVPNETIGNCPSASASASITIKHRIRQVGEAPPGAALAVQLGLDYRLESSPYQALGSSTTNASFSIKYGQTVDGVYSDNGRCQPGRSCSGRMYVEGSTSDIVEITAQAGANAYCVITPDGPRGVTAQAVADPFLFIDPNWEWASAFVVEQESVKNPGEWVEVTRLWQTDSFPVADAGEDQSATFIGSIIQLDGSQSFDPDGDPITYHWEFVSTPPGEWRNAKRPG